METVVYDTADGADSTTTTASVRRTGSGSDSVATGSAVFVTQQFPPDKSGHSSRLRETTTSLSEEGWDVSVICPPASFPHGEFARSWRRIERESLDGVSVTRLWTWQPGCSNPGFLSRLSHYILFSLHATLWLLLYGRSHDVIVTTTPPIMTSLAGFHSRLTGQQWVVDIRDLWIDASVSLGFISEGGVLERFSRLFQRLVFRTADGIAVTTETLGERLCEHYGNHLSEKLWLVPNGVTLPDESTVVPTQNGHREDEKHGGESGSEQYIGKSTSNGSVPEQEVERPASRKILYTGNIGHAQDLDTCILALQYLPEPVTLELVGGGDAVPALKSLADEVGVRDRVEFAGTVPHEEIPSVLDEARVGIAPLRDDPELAYAMPTKVYEYLGNGLPAVTTGRGELERFIERSGGGVHTENDPQSIATAIETLLRNDTLHEKASRRGREYVRERYDREAIARRFSDHLGQLIDSEQEGHCE